MQSEEVRPRRPEPTQDRRPGGRQESVTQSLLPQMAANVEWPYSVLFGTGRGWPPRLRPLYQSLLSTFLNLPSKGDGTTTLQGSQVCTRDLYPLHGASVAVMRLLARGGRWVGRRGSGCRRSWRAPTKSSTPSASWPSSSPFHCASWCWFGRRPVWPWLALLPGPRRSLPAGRVAVAPSRQNLATGPVGPLLPERMGLGAGGA